MAHEFMQALDEELGNVVNADVFEHSKSRLFLTSSAQESSVYTI